MQRALYTVYIFAKLNTKRFFRDRLALFFGILFPVIFLFIFGSMSRGEGSSFNVAIFNQSETSFSKSFVQDLQKQKFVKEKDAVNLEDAKVKMGRGELESILVLPADFGKPDPKGRPSGHVDVYFKSSDPQAGQTFASLVQGVLGSYNYHLVHDLTPLTVSTKASDTRGLSRFDYTFAGLLGFAIIGLGIFGPVNVFPELKKQGILRRLHTTPLKVWQYFISTMVSQAIIGLVSVAVMFVVALVVFDLKVVGNYFEIAIFTTLSIITILGLGLAIGGWARNERQAAPLSNIVVFPLMFLSGTFFPRFLMPHWLQTVSGYLPLTPVIDGLRLIISEGKHLVDLGPQLGLMALWLIVIYIIAFRVFRWE